MPISPAKEIITVINPTVIPFLKPLYIFTIYIHSLKKKKKIVEQISAGLDTFMRVIMKYRF